MFSSWVGYAQYAQISRILLSFQEWNICQGRLNNQFQCALIGLCKTKGIRKQKPACKMQSHIPHIKNIQGCVQLT